MGMGLLILCMLFLCSTETAFAQEGVIACTVLGDSIAKGYYPKKMDPITCYGQLVMNQLCEEHETQQDFATFAKSGMDTTQLNETVLELQEVKWRLRRSDLILLTMGSNDLLYKFRSVAQEILESTTKYKSAEQALKELKDGVKENPLILLKIVDTITHWDYDSFEQQWEKAMEQIAKEKKEGAQLIVTTIYNPVSSIELPGTLNLVVQTIIQNMNSIIWDGADTYGYQVVDLYRSKIVSYLQPDGLHPTQEGQEYIAQLVMEQVNSWVWNQARIEEIRTQVQEPTEYIEELFLKESVREANRHLIGRKVSNRRTAGGQLTSMLILAMLFATPVLCRGIYKVISQARHKNFT
jgi:lysophospholipase L1-like esterase